MKSMPIANGTDPVVDTVKDRRARVKIMFLFELVNYVRVREAKFTREDVDVVGSSIQGLWIDPESITTSLTISNCMAIAHKLRGIGF